MEHGNKRGCPRIFFKDLNSPGNRMLEILNSCILTHHNMNLHTTSYPSQLLHQLTVRTDLLHWFYGCYQWGLSDSISKLTKSVLSKLVINSHCKYCWFWLSIGCYRPERVGHVESPRESHSDRKWRAFNDHWSQLNVCLAHEVGFECSSRQLPTSEVVWMKPNSKMSSHNEMMALYIMLIRKKIGAE